MLDFNDIPKEQPQSTLRDEVKQALLSRLDSVLERIMPQGQIHGQRFVVGNIQGDPGESLSVTLDGENAGLWLDFATGEGGDIFDLLAATHGLDAKNDFAQVLEIAQNLLGQAPKKVRRQKQNMDDLGPATAKYDYFDAQGKLIACVYRYDPPGRKKEFRPYDVATGKHKAPEPRPLFNQPGMLQAETVVLVEGEKCALALTNAGYCATTAMHGAKAPVNKTDWSPLAGKDVLIWPDNDEPGAEYAKQVSQAIMAAGANSCAIMVPHDDAPEGWDAADAIAEGADVAEFIASARRIPVVRASSQSVAALLQQVYWHTEDGLATIFTQRYQNEWKYCRIHGAWLVWDGRRWNQDRQGAVSEAIRSICTVAAHMAEKPSLQSKLASAGTIASVERLARKDPGHATLPEDWDNQPWFLNTPGGIVDLQTGSTRPFQRDLHISKITTAKPLGDAPMWRQFLADVTGGNGELQSYLQRVAGYCLTGSIREHALFFLYGTGANGKSVFLNVLSEAMGDYSTNTPAETFMDSAFQRHSTELASLAGSRMVMSSETEQGAFWAESRIKAITGGDTITARFLYQNEFRYRPQFKLVIAGNHKPLIRNIDEAVKRRLHLIPFTVTIPTEKRDHNLTEKLLAERDGIMAWAVKGCLEWQRIGLRAPAIVQSATEQYFEDEDGFGSFIAEEFNPNHVEATPVDILYRRYVGWANDSGEFVGSKKWFVQQMVKRGFERKKGNKGTRMLIGYAIMQKAREERLPYADN